MKKLLVLIVIGSMIPTFLSTHPRSFLSIYAKASAHHLFFSVQGIKDSVATYGVMMLVTLIHELGHAVVAKALCGAPIDVVIGGPRREHSSLKLGGVEFAGFNPLQSLVHWKGYKKPNGETFQSSTEQEIAVSIAGPLAQAITGMCLYSFLKNKRPFPLAKAAALGAAIDAIVGVNGIYGAWYLPWSDSAKIVANVKKYFQAQPQKTKGAPNLFLCACTRDYQ